MKDLRRSLRTRVILYAGLGLAIALALITLQASRILSTATNDLLTEWRDGVRRSASQLENQVESDQLVIDGLASQVAALPSGSPGAAPLLRSALPHLDLLNDGLFWVSPTGRVLAAFPGPVASEQLLPKSLSQALPLLEEGHRLSGLQQSRNGHHVVTYAARTGAEGTLLAVVDLDARPLDEYLPLPASSGHAALVDGAGWVLASNRADLRYTQGEHSTWAAHVEQEGRPVVEETSGQGGKEPHMMAFAPVGDTGWGLMFGEPASVALATRMGFIHQALLFGLLADMLVVLYSWRASGGLTEPLQRLSGLAERIAAGDLDTAVRVVRQDEVGTLARALNTMRIRLKWSRDELNGLLSETQRREEATAALYAVSQETLQPGKADNALELVAERTRELLGGASAAICLADGPGGSMRAAAVARPPAEAQPAEPDGKQSSPAAAVLLCTGPNGCEEPAACPLRQIGAAREPASAPIVGATAGRLCVMEQPDHPLGPEEQRLLAGLADLAALATARERLQQQSRELAVYAERERIARDLHDTVSQSLSYLYSQLELLQAILPQCSPERLTEELHSLSDVASATFEATRDSIYRLRNPGSTQDSLPTAIAGCVRDFTARTGISVDLDADAVARTPLPAETEAQLVRVVQEALANVAKHAGATRVAVTAEEREGGLQITVEDNGSGFDPTRPRQGRRSFGLEMMRERAESVGGLLNIQSSPGKGTRVQLRIATQS